MHELSFITISHTYYYEGAIAAKAAIRGMGTVGMSFAIMHRPDDSKLRVIPIRWFTH